MGLLWCQMGLKFGIYGRNYEGQLISRYSHPKLVGIFEIGRRFIIPARFGSQVYIKGCVRVFFKENKIKKLECVSLSPIEHLYDFIKREIRKTPVSNKQEIRNQILEIWNNIDQEMPQNFVHSMPRRL